MQEPKLVVKTMKVPTGQMVVTVPKEISRGLAAANIQYVLISRRGLSLSIEPIMPESTPS